MNTAPASDWRGIGIAFLAGVAAAIALAKASPAALPLRADLGLTLVQIGWVMALGTLATAGLGVVSGTLSYRYGPRRLALVGAALMVFAGIAGAVAPGLHTLLASRALEGLGVVLITVAAPALIATLARPADMGMAMGVWALWMPAGSLLVLLLAPPVLQAAGWRGLWALSALAAALVLPFLARLEVAPRRAPVSALQLLRRARPWLLALVFMAFSFQFFSVFTFLPTLLVARLGLDARTAALAIALVPLGIIPGNLLGGVLVARGVAPWQVMALPALGLMLWAPLLLHGTGSVWGMLALLPVYGLLLGIIPTGIFVQAPRLATTPAGAPQVLGLAMSGQGFGILLGPPSAGAVLERAGWGGVGLLVCVALGVLVLAAGALRAPAGN